MKNQDEMRADIPAQMLQELFDAATDAGNLLFLPWRDVRDMRNETAERINAAIAAIRSLPCAQQSALSQQDALDAARWRSARTGEDHVKLVNTGGKLNPELWLDIADEQADWAVDAQTSISAQGASNV